MGTYDGLLSGLTIYKLNKLCFSVPALISLFSGSKIIMKAGSEITTVVIKNELGFNSFFT